MGRMQERNAKEGEPRSRQLRLDLLHTFEAAARHLSFTRAGGELFLSQSAVSRQVQQLEESIGAALFECWEGLKIESNQNRTLDPLKHGGSGLVTRAGGALSGPLPAALRLISLFSGSKNQRSLRRAAAASAIAGSLLTRIAWIYAGHVSAKDWQFPLGISAK